MIGVLDLQGGVAEHIEHFAALGVEAIRVKKQADLAGLQGLVIPGGESTCLLKLLDLFSLRTPLCEMLDQGTPVWGTCAGAIVLAKSAGSQIPVLNRIDISVERNAFGGQLASFKCQANVPAVAKGPVPLTFIRAPKIRSAGPEVSVLLKMDDFIAMAEAKQTLVTVFHPELTSCLAFHRYFAHKCGLKPLAAPDPEHDAEDPATWDTTRWMQIQS